MRIKAACFNLMVLSMIFIVQSVSGQTNIASTAEGDKVRARAYQISALDQYNAGNYDKALEYCKEVERYLNTMDPFVEAIRIKSYYSIGDYSKAKISLDLFLRLDAESSLVDEMIPYIVLIDDSIREEDDFFNRAKENKSVEDYQAYLEKYPNGRFRHEAERLMKIQVEDDAWTEAQNKGTVEGYYEYITIYHNGNYVADARENIAALDLKAYTEATTEHTQESLNNYLDSYSLGEYREDVEKKLKERIEYDVYLQAKSTNDIEDYIVYVEEYPEGKYAIAANQEIEEGLYVLGNAAYDAKNYHRAKTYFTKYVSRFPDGIYVVDIHKKLKKSERKTK